jgi:hypothetical protein
MKTHNENYDLEFLDNVKEEVKVILELCKSNFFHQSISEDEIKAAFLYTGNNVPILRMSEISPVSNILSSSFCRNRCNI